MPFTGADFNEQLDIKTDQAYTGYYDIPKKNVIVREAVTKAIEIKVADNNRVQVQDDLFAIFKTNATYAPVLNQVSLIPSGTGISDYHHVMNVKAKFSELLQNIYITSASNTTPIRLGVNRYVNLRDTEQVSITGVAGNTNANGTRYVKKLREDLYWLYSDVNLRNSVAGNGVFSGNAGQVSRIIYNTAYDLKSGRKFSKLSEATTHDPMWEVADGNLKIYPLTETCPEISVDYISTPVYPDLGDTTIDLLETYSQRFIDFIIDETCKLLGMDMRDGQLVMQSSSEIINQP